MKTIAKWIVIGWSLCCLLGVFSGLANVGTIMEGLTNEYEQAGASVGVGCGMGIWVFIWLAIAGPGMFVYLIASNKKEEKTQPIPGLTPSRLCIDCGKYYEHNPNFCPHCGKPISK